MYALFFFTGFVLIIVTVLKVIDYRNHAVQKTRIDKFKNALNDMDHADKIEQFLTSES